MVAYPQSQPVFTSPVSGDFLSAPAHAALHTQEDLEIEAIAAELGLNPSGIVFPTVVTRLEAIEASITSLEFVDLTDTPSDYSGAALQVVRVNAGGTGLEFFPGGATTFVGLTDTPADYTSQSLNLYRVNVGETGVESVTPDYALISAGDAATDITAVELETLTDGSNADALHIHSGGSSASEVTFDINQNAHGLSVGDWIRHNGTIYVTAQADVDANSDALGVVSAVAGVDDFTIFLHGYITGLSGLTVGVAHFISDTVAGAITDVPPADLGEIVKPVLVADSATTGYVNVLRGNEVTAAIPGITVDDEGTPITTDVSSFDFVGAGVTATNSGDDVTITIPGGGVSTFVGLSDTPANFTSQSLDFYRVNAGETAVEAVTLTYALVSAGDGATDVTAAELETLTDGSNADALHVHAGGGATLDHDVNQTTHGFSVNDWIYHNGTIYALADASAAATAESIGIVNAVAGANDFTVQFGGRITGLSSLTVGEAHFLSETPGTITATAPSTVTAVVKPVLIADTTTTGFIFNMRGSAVTDSTSFTDSFVDGDLSTGVLTITHNLGRQYVQVQIFDENDQLVQPDDVTLTDSDTTTVDLLSFGAISGTWHFVIMDSGATSSFQNTTFTQTFVDGDLAAGILTATHNLSDQYPLVTIYDNNDVIIIPDDVTGTSTTVSTVDLNSFGTLTGTWRVVISAIGGTAAASPTNTSFRQSFVDGDLSAGVLTVAHNLSQQYVQVQIFNNNSDLINPDDVTLTDADNLDVDISGFGTITGTWNVVILSSGSTDTSTASDLSLSGQTAEDFTVFDGTNWQALGGTELVKVGTFTRDNTIASGSQSIVGVGFRPKSIGFFASRNAESDTSWGFSDGTDDRAVYTVESTTETLADGNDSIRMNTGSGDNNQGRISSFDSDGFTIAWVRGGSPTGTTTIVYQAYR